MKPRSTFLLLVVLAFFSAAIVHAQDGFNLSWDDCGTSGTSLKTFACNSNSGTDRLIVSASCSQPLPQLVGVELTSYVVMSGPSVSPWWHMEQGGCRFGSLSAILDFTAGPYSCFDPWSGAAAGGISYEPGYGGVPNMARMRGVAAIAGSTAAPSNTELYVFGFRFAHQKSLGTGSCPGCTDGACVALSQVKLDQIAGVGDFVLSIPLSRGDAGYQCSSAVYTDDTVPCHSSCPVPARNRSWGTIKSLYR